MAVGSGATLITDLNETAWLDRQAAPRAQRYDRTYIRGARALSENDIWSIAFHQFGTMLLGRNDGVPLGVLRPTDEASGPG